MMLTSVMDALKTAAILALAVASVAPLALIAKVMTAMRSLPLQEPDHVYCHCQPAPNPR